MGQNILPCFVWKNTKESENLTQIPKPHLSTSLTYIINSVFTLLFMWFISVTRFSLFIYIRPLVFPFNSFTLVIFGALYSLLFGVSLGSVFETYLDL